MPPTKFQLNPTYIREQMSFQNFQAGHHGDHLGSWNEFSNSKFPCHPHPHPPLSPTKFRLNPTYRSGAYVVCRFSRWPQWWPSWILEQNDFSNSESLCCSDVSHQVSVQSDLQFGRRCRLKIFKMAIWWPS